MSKERQRRRAEREAEQARVAAEHARLLEKQQRHRSRVARLKAWLPRRTRWARQTGLLHQRRQRRMGFLIFGILAIQVLAWSLSPNWYLRIGVALVSLLVFPLAVVLIAPRSR